MTESTGTGLCFLAERKRGNEMLRRVEIDLLRLYSQVLTTTTIGFFLCDIIIKLCLLVGCVGMLHQQRMWSGFIDIYIYIIFFLILHFLRADVVKGMKTKVVFFIHKGKVCDEPLFS